MVSEKFNTSMYCEPVLCKASARSWRRYIHGKSLTLAFIKLRAKWEWRVPLFAPSPLPQPLLIRLSRSPAVKTVDYACKLLERKIEVILRQYQMKGMQYEVFAIRATYSMLMKPFSLKCGDTFFFPQWKWNLKKNTCCLCGLRTLDFLSSDLLGLYWHGLWALGVKYRDQNILQFTLIVTKLPVKKGNTCCDDQSASL